MSIIDTAVTGSKRIEIILKDEFNAEGKGLHECLSSVEGRVPSSIIKKARFIASVRNKVVHESGQIDDIAAFNQTVDDVVQGLKEVLEIERRAKNESDTSQSTVTTKAAEPSKKTNVPASIATLLFGGIVGLFVGMEVGNSQEKVAALESQLSQKNSNIAELKGQLYAARDASKPSKPTQSERKVTKQANDSEAEQLSANESELLKMASESSNQFENASAELTQKFVPLVKKLIDIKTGKPSVSEDDRGTYTVRLPVSYSIPANYMLNRLSRYFSGYNGRSLKVVSERRLRGKKNKIIITQSAADSPNSRSALSKRLYDVLQGMQVDLVATVGSKTGRLVIAGNVDCHVTCSYADHPERSWMLQLNGEPGDGTVSNKFTTPILIEGVTKADLAKQSSPTVEVKQVEVSRY